MPLEQWILAFLVGAAVASGSVWWWLNRKVRDLTEASTKRQDELSALQRQFAALEERAKRVEELQSEKQMLASERDQLSTQVSDFNAERARLRTQLEERAKAVQESRDLLEKAKEEFKEAFSALSGDALRKNNQAFLDLAKSALETDKESAQKELEKRKVAIEELVKPLNERLEKVNESVSEIEKKRAEAYASLGEMVKGLGERQVSLERETRNLVHALRTPVRRGQWGEIQLKRVVEMAGMIEHCDFETQVSIETDDGKLRPDVVINLPNNMSIIVDAKVALDAYIQATEAEDEGERKRLMERHAQQVKQHIDQLSHKSYWDQFKQSPDFVLMFLPGEPLFSAALEQDPGLINHGMEKRVLIATPVTLIALLRAANIGWQHVSLEQDARKIAEAGKELLKRFSKVGQELASVGRHLDMSVKSYNDMVASLDSRLMPKLREFEAFRGIDSAAVELPEFKLVDKVPREIAAPELHSLPGLE